MISIEAFKKIETEVKEALDEALDNLKSSSLENYILFIANGEYMNCLEKDLKLNPNIIDDRTWFFDDETRLVFLNTFLNAFYSFSYGKDSVDDDIFRINLELMVYSHIWESIPFLKRFFRLASLVNGDRYPWKVTVPKRYKHDFIRNKIKDIFLKNKLNLGNIIAKGFHSSLRNAFAHSQYNIDLVSKKIILRNYEGKYSWELPDIFLDEWSKRFVYSIWMSYLLIKVTIERRKNLISEFETNRFVVSIPSKDGKSILSINILYDPDKDSFYYDQKKNS